MALTNYSLIVELYFYLKGDPWIIVIAWEQVIFQILERSVFRYMLIPRICH